MFPAGDVDALKSQRDVNQVIGKELSQMVQGRALMPPTVSGIDRMHSLAERAVAALKYLRIPACLQYEQKIITLLALTLIKDLLSAT